MAAAIGLIARSHTDFWRVNRWNGRFRFSWARSWLLQQNEHRGLTITTGRLPEASRPVLGGTHVVLIASPVLGETGRERIIDSGTITTGRAGREYEPAFATHSGTTHGIATTNTWLTVLSLAVHPAVDGAYLDHIVEVIRGGAC